MTSPSRVNVQAGLCLPVEALSRASSVGVSSMNSKSLLPITRLTRQCTAECLDHGLHQHAHEKSILQTQTPSQASKDSQAKVSAATHESTSESKAAATCSASTPHQCVLVTGGAGFIGSHVACRLVKLGCRVVIVDELNDFYSPAIKESNLDTIRQVAGEFELQDKLHIYKADVCDAKEMRRIYDLHRFTQIIHLAARAGVRPSLSDPFLYVQANIVGTLTLLELCRESKGRINHFVFASSSSVYGDASSTGAFRETGEADQCVSQYATTKRCTELLATTYTHLYPEMRCSALRFFTV